MLRLKYDKELYSISCVIKLYFLSTMAESLKPNSEYQSRKWMLGTCSQGEDVWIVMAVKCSIWKGKFYSITYLSTHSNIIQINIHCTKCMGIFSYQKKEKNFLPVSCILSLCKIILPLSFHKFLTNSSCYDRKCSVSEAYSVVLWTTSSHTSLSEAWNAMSTSIFCASLEFKEFTE